MTRARRLTAGLLFSLTFLFSLQIAALEADRFVQSFAQGQADAVTEAGPSVLGAGMGYQSLDGHHYIALSLGLELDFGVVGLGIQVPMNVLVYNWDTAEGSTAEKLFRKEDWDEWQDYLKMLRYLRVFHKGDPFYARLGSLDNTRIGHGTIMNDYYNNILTDHFALGLVMDVNTKWVGVETVINDLMRARLFGGRVWVAPLSFFMENEFFHRFRTGFTYLIDRNAPTNLETTSDDPNNPDPNFVPAVVVDSKNRPSVEKSRPMQMVGWDLEWRVLDMDMFKLTPYQDINFVVTPLYNAAGRKIDTPVGYHLGVMFDVIPTEWFTLQTRLEYRFLRKGYLPNYFNSQYDIERMMIPGVAVTDDGTGLSKLSSLYQTTRDLNGYFAEAAFRFSTWVVIGANFEDYQGSPNAQLTVFASVPALEVIEVGALYTWRNFEGFKNAFKFDDRSLFVAYAKGRFAQMFYAVASFTRTWEFRDGRYRGVNDWNIGFGMEYTFDM